MMKIGDLKDSVNSIHMKDEMREAIIENVNQREYRSKKKAVTAEKNDHMAIHSGWKSTGWRKIAAAAFMLVILSGIVAFPVRALVNSLVRERLEAMPEKEVETIIDDEMRTRVAADGFTRAYTDSERERYQALAEKYQSGTFPEKEIVKVESIEDVKQDEVCFVVPDSIFYLPERELTDEEILEIIDYDVKRNYALKQNYEREYADEIAQKEEEQKEQIADNVADGGITEQQAIEIATEKLYDIFGSRGEGMELSSRYSSESGFGTAWEPRYSINWANEVTHKIYYIDLSARDGHVMRAVQTDPDATDDSALPIEEAKGKIPALRRQAEEFMEKMEISYENVYIYYLESAEGTVSRDGARFVFVTSGEDAYGVTYRWYGMLHTYAELDFADYQGKDGEMRTLHIKGEEVEMKQIFQKLDNEQ